ncbi:MAG: SRPBCC domain-containing protein [Acidobacteriota bacterium]
MKTDHSSAGACAPPPGLRSFTKPELVKRWLLGLDGWSMPGCEIDLRVGGAYRYGKAASA